MRWGTGLSDHQKFTYYFLSKHKPSLHFMMSLQKAHLTWNQLSIWEDRQAQMKGWSKGWNSLGWPLSFWLPHIVFWKNFILFGDLNLQRALSRDFLFPEGKMFLPTVLEKLSQNCCFFYVFNEYCVWMGDESVESRDSWWNDFIVHWKYIFLKNQTNVPILTMKVTKNNIFELIEGWHVIWSQPIKVVAPSDYPLTSYFFISWPAVIPFPLNTFISVLAAAGKIHNCITCLLPKGK